MTVTKINETLGPRITNFTNYRAHMVPMMKGGDGRVKEVFVNRKRSSTAGVAGPGRGGKGRRREHEWHEWSPNKTNTARVFNRKGTKTDFASGSQALGAEERGESEPQTANFLVNRELRELRERTGERPGDKKPETDFSPQGTRGSTARHSRNQRRRRKWITNITNGTNHTNEPPFFFHSREACPRPDRGTGIHFTTKTYDTMLLKITTEIKENAME
ncbi:MAG: hypothetical protein C4532_00025 [Candidatus Abyssobacteria bacterium SURF_17]|uniref:Uncharacterized protein n=1 Tax=Candidatus Abyssobacteria bacterium SURF_17 TaxID=2093361 RepID=A0A419FA34_9BACT|nr:MAG: hypothetical protein C4532_00025 [Candidatus Abyssubacteria bacterium SURF_17]